MYNLSEWLYPTTYERFLPLLTCYDIFSDDKLHATECFCVRVCVCVCVCVREREKMFLPASQYKNHNGTHHTERAATDLLHYHIN